MIDLDLGELVEIAGRKPSPLSYCFVDVGTGERLPPHGFISWLLLGNEIDRLTGPNTSGSRVWMIEIEMSDGTKRAVTIQPG